MDWVSYGQNFIRCKSTLFFCSCKMFFKHWDQEIQTSSMLCSSLSQTYISTSHRWRYKTNVLMMTELLYQHSSLWGWLLWGHTLWKKINIVLWNMTWQSLFMLKTERRVFLSDVNQFVTAKVKWVFARIPSHINKSFHNIYVTPVFPHQLSQRWSFKQMLLLWWSCL